MITFSGLKECDGEAVDGAEAPATVLTTLGEVKSLSCDVAVVLIKLDEAANRESIVSLVL